MNAPLEHSFKPLPRWVLRAVLLLSGVCGVCSIALAIIASLIAPQPIWVLFGFEIVAIAAAAIGVLFGLGRFQDGQGLALACIAGTLAVGTFLPWLGTRQGVVLYQGGPTVSLLPWVAARIGAALVFGALGAWAVLRRDPRSTHYSLRAAAAFGGIVLMGAGLFLLRGPMASWEVVPRVASFAMVGLISLPLFCAGVHCTIRAFECGRTDDQPASE